MTPGIRFHLDEHVNPAIADALRIRNIDVSTTIEAGLSAASDEGQLAFALREGRVFVTHDRDFLVLTARGLQHAGICYSHQHARSVSELIKALSLLAYCINPADMHNRVEFL